jgi:diacylglycerol kinase (ATP)
MAGSCLTIVNPISAGGATAKRWPRIRDSLARHINFDVAQTEYPQHAIRLGIEARELGYSRVICVGGDGTLNEVVNGILQGSPDIPLPEVGMVPSGTGSDLARSIGIARDTDEACARLAAPYRQLTDLGLVAYRGASGEEQRYFVNAAGLGYAAEVVSRRNGFNRYLRGTLPYLASVATTLMTHRNSDVKITLDGSTSSHRVTAVVLAIGQYFGGGMRVAPNAILDDGMFDVVTIGDVTHLELVYNFPRVYRGTHLNHPKVRAERARSIAVESDQPMLVQADGELLGLSPVRFQILPRALTLLR